MRGMPVNNEVDGTGRVVQQALAEVDECGGVLAPSSTANRSAPLADTTEIMFTENRAPGCAPPALAERETK